MAPHPMKLSSFTRDRDNNFNLIRIVASLAVLITHSFALAIGSGDAEPFRDSLGMTLGSIAVDVFFVTSGLLVTGSLLTRQSAVEFAWARLLRIFPALVVMVALTVLGLGSFFTSLQLVTYLTDSKPYAYFLKCSTLVAGVAYDLPGVFEGNPYGNAVNGSLWTMPYELSMYGLLLLGWVTVRIGKSFGLGLFKLTLVSAAAAAGAILLLATPLHFNVDMLFTRLFFMFFSGAAFYVLKDHIELSERAFFGCVLALVFSVMTGKLQLFFAFYVITIAYVLLYLAYIPSGHVRKFNLVGDYSYGVYIYAFPVQQSVAALMPGISVFVMVVISATVTLICAALSWHLLERRALGLKGLYVGHTRRILAWISMA